MKTPEQRAELLRQQVISKVLWGASRHEVAGWLSEEHGLSGIDAERLLSDADRARRRAIRGRALIRVVLSAVGLGLATAFLCVRYSSGPIFYRGRAGMVTVFAIGIGGYSLLVFARSITRLLTGETLGPVD